MEVTHREAVIYLYLKRKGDWDGIYDEIINRRDEDTPEKISEVVEKYLKEHKAVSITEDGPIANIMKTKITHKPPFVLEYKGDEGVAKSVLEGKKIVAVTNTRVWDKLISEDKFVVGMVKEVGIIRLGTKDKVLELNENGDVGNAAIRLGQMADKILLDNDIKKDDDEEDGVSGIGFKIFIGSVKEAREKEVFAIPGNTGCLTNKMIKKGMAKLCDTIRDLDDETDLEEDEEEDL